MPRVTFALGILGIEKESSENTSLENLFGKTSAESVQQSMQIKQLEKMTANVAVVR